MKNILFEFSSADLEHAYVIARNNGVTEYVDEPDNPMYDYRTRRYLFGATDSIENLISASIVSYVDTDKYVSTTEDMHHLDVNERYFDTAANYISPIRIRQDGTKYYYILVPVLRDSVVKGVVCLEIGYSGFEERFISDSTYQSTGIFLLANEDGDVLIQSSTSDLTASDFNRIIGDAYFADKVIYDDQTNRYYYLEEVNIIGEETTYFVFSQTEDELFELRRRVFFDTGLMIVILLFIYALLNFISGQYYHRLISEDTKLVLEEEVREQTKVLRKQARRDSLTQIYNHKVLIDKLEETLLGGGTTSILMIDIDFFKEVNDTYGHVIGDEVLVDLSSLLLQSIRFEDVAGRYGGEEFMVILKDTDLEVGYMIAERIRMDVMNYKFTNQELNITISIGLAEYAGEDATSFIKRADKLLYQSKASGRNMTTM